MSSQPNICFRAAVFAVALALGWPVAATGQPAILVGNGFSEAYIAPALLRDASAAMSVAEISSTENEQHFAQASTPFFTFGADPANWWVRFQAKNTLAEPQTIVLQLNRKNFDEFRLWQRDSTGALHDCGAVGVLAKTGAEFWMTDGYYYALTLPPGQTTTFFGVAFNRVGSMHLGLSLHSTEHFSQISRQNSTAFGLFLGVMVIALAFASFLFAQYRDAVYFFYIIYVLNILLREAHEFSADFGLFPNVQRHATSLLVAATFGMFYRNFLQLRSLAPRLDVLVKWYIWAVAAASMAIVFLTASEKSAAMNAIFEVLNATNLFFTFVAVVAAAWFCRRSLRARVTLLAFLPLAGAFTSILLRNMTVIGNYPWIHHAVMWGFVFEVLILTTVFSVWHRIIESDRRVLQLQLEQEKLEKQLAVQSAEQRVKDRIARDLHDDVAASMSGIRILSQVARKHFAEKSPESVPILEQINQSAQSAAESISDLIWAVKPTGDYLNDIADRIREYASKMLDAANVDYRINIPRDLPALDMDIETKRNLYLIFKEAVNNALKYSHCSHMEIEQCLENQLLTLQISDNGKGFDPATTPRGNGLNNMTKRAHDIGAALHVISSPDKGTTISLSLRLED